MTNPRETTRHCAACEEPANSRLCSTCGAHFAESGYAQQRGDHRGRAAAEVDQELREYRTAALWLFWMLADADDPGRELGLAQAVDDMTTEVRRYHAVADMMPPAVADRFVRATAEVLLGIVFDADQRADFRRRLQREFPGLTQIPDAPEPDPADRLGTRVFDWPEDPTAEDQDDQDDAR